MNYLLDACTLLNLSHGHVLAEVVRLPGDSFSASSAVLRECASIRDEIIALIAAHHLVLLQGTEISATRYLALKGEHQLGDGETECLTYALASDFTVAIDDRRARAVATSLLGQTRVSGSIGLLRECVTRGVISRCPAYAAITKMRRRGGFLPNMSKEELFPRA